MTVEVIEVDSKKRQGTFLALPWKLYKGDPMWVPPLRVNQRELVNFRPHPFYNNAEIQTFLAQKNGQVCGRIAAIVDHGHNDYHKENRGMFGFFESTNDRAVSDALFNTARNWFHQRGIRDMRGPVNPSMNYECGLLIDGFDSPPTFMMTYNPPFYQELIEGYGFQKAQDLLAFYGHRNMLESLDKKMQFIVEEAVKRFKLNLRRLDPKHFDRDVHSFLDIYNKSLPGQWGFVPLSETELKHMSKGLKLLIVPILTSIAEDETGPVAVVFGLLDYNPIIKRIDGRLFPFGFLRLLFGRKSMKRVRLISTNVLPQYQKWGLGLVLMARIVPEALDYGLQEAEFSWVLESNKLSRGSLERGGAKLIKTYRIFDYNWQ